MRLTGLLVLATVANLASALPHIYPVTDTHSTGHSDDEIKDGILHNIDESKSEDIPNDTTQLNDKIKLHRRKSIENEYSIPTEMSTPDVKPHGQLCIHKFNTVARASRVSVDGTLKSNYDDNDFDDEEYENREPALSNFTIPGVGIVKAELCPPMTNFCYALWTENPQNGDIIILGQGCWELSDRHDPCKANECRMDKPPSRADPTTKFCCCKSQFCNVSPTSSLPPYDPLAPIGIMSVSPIVNITKSEYQYIIPIAAIVLVVLVVFTLIYIISKCFTTEKEANVDGNDIGSNVETGGPGFSCSATCVDNLKLHDNIGSGKHAKVWRGSLGGVPVAVKALPASRMTLWARERDLYSMPHMRHPNLLQYFGCDTRPTLEGPSEHLLVLQLAPLGSLRNFLIDHTLDWEVYTNMALGIASALAHLHTHIDKDGQYKPCIVHRDVNSSNIVVRADLTCCLGDLGLAMSLPDVKSHPTQPQNHRIQEAGTLRYLAPEALEGALDLRRCAASLRAVDVYSLALVLWELLSRCSTLHRAPGPLAYAPPFHAEVGDQPTLERMQVVVGIHKARPLFSTRLLSIRATRLARDTCEDCWDHDADARLTAVCVVERLTELKSMRPAPSPTINSNDLRPPTQHHDSTPNWHSPGSCEDKNSNVTLSVVANANLIDFQANVLQKLPLQPHQGRNPCLERNLASVGYDDRLIDKSLKDMPSNSPTSLPNNDYGSNNFIRVEHSNLVQNFQNAPQDFSRPEEHTAGAMNYGRHANRNYQNTYSAPQDVPSHDDQIEFRQMARPVTPIGYVQNDVSGDVNGVVFPNAEGNPYGYPAKRSNMLQEVSQPRWGTKRLRDFLDSKLFKKKSIQNQPVPLETEVNLVLSNGKPVNNMNTTNGKFKTSVVLNDTKGKLNRDISDASDPCVDRPSSLPGLDSVVIASVAPTERLQNETSSSTSKNLNYLENNMCAISPPNRTISHHMMIKVDDKIGSDSIIAGYKELPAYAIESAKSPNQIFAVIVPKPAVYNTKPSNDVVEWQHRNNIELPPKCNTSKQQYSCDDESDSKTEDSFKKCNRNSYSGELEIGNFCKYNKDDDPAENGLGIDYSSNSEDEHMLLLSENGGSKITMRQRYDAKPSQDSNKKNKALSSSQSIQESGSGLSKIAAESFSSLCSKYGKSKYENLKNDMSDFKTDHQSLLLVKDAASINHRNRKFRLSVCRDDGVDLNKQAGSVDSNEDANDSEKTLNSNTKCNGEDTSSDDDVTLPEEAPKRNSNGFRPLSIKQNLSRQHSLELVSELFSSSADLTRLKDPASRIKTPGDVPPSVRKMRGSLGSRIRRSGSAKENSKAASNRLSLYDDRMMFGNSL